MCDVLTQLEGSGNSVQASCKSYTLCFSFSVSLVFSSHSSNDMPRVTLAMISYQERKLEFYQISVGWLKAFLSFGAQKCCDVVYRASSIMLFSIIQPENA